MGNQLRSETILIGEGTALSSLPVLEVLQDQEGFLWFFTKDGMARYDGKKQEIYPLNDFEKTKNNEITSVIHDNNGVFWLGTNQGKVFRFIIAEETMEEVTIEDLPKQPIDALYIKDDENLHISNNQNIYQYNLKRKSIQVLKIQSADEALEEVIVKKIIKDKQGNFIYGTNKGIQIQKGETLTAFHSILNSPKGNVNDIWIDKEGTLWIASNNGFFSYTEEDGFINHAPNFKFYKSQSLQRQTSNNIFLGITQQENGDFYLATENSGIIRYNPKSQQAIVYTSDYNNPYAISNNRVNKIFRDRDGNLWLGLNGEINFISKEKNMFEHTRRGIRSDISMENHLLSDYINAIAQDADGNLWIGSTKGISRYVNQSDEIDIRNELNDKEVTALKQADNKMWAGTTQGLYMWTKDASYVEVLGMTGKQITAIDIDANNRVYVGTTKGLYRVEQNQNESVLSEVSLYADSSFIPEIMAIHIDNKNRIWLGTNDGLYQLSKEGTKVERRLRNDMDSENSIASDAVNAIWVDDEERVWVATKGMNGGVLNQINLNDESILRYEKKNGIDVDEIFAIIGEKEAIWMSSNRGVFRLDLQRKTMSEFTMNNGLQSNNFRQGSAYMDSNEEIFFGGDNGFNSFNPKEIVTQTRLLPVLITNIYIDGQVVSREDKIVLTHRNNTLTIEFAILDYAYPDKARYMYQLEGVDKVFIPSGNRNIATYANLSAGKYTFLVKPDDSYEAKSITPTEINIVMKPHPLRTWWAILGYVLLAMGSVYAYVRFKTSLQMKELEQQKIVVDNLRKLDKMKDDFLANTSHELKTPLNGIIGITETLRDGMFGELPEKAKNNMSVVLNSAKRLLKMVNDILDLSVMNQGDFNVEIKSVNFREIFDECRGTLQAIAEKKKLTFKDKVSHEDVQIFGDAYRIQQVLFNIVGNAIKFTKHGFVEVGTFPNGECLDVYIKDTGRGIPKEKLEVIFQKFAQVDSSDSKEYAGTGLGLSITQNLLNLMDAKVRVDSQPGEGTTFWLSFPRAKETNAVEIGSYTIERYIEPVQEEISMEQVLVAPAQMNLKDYSFKLDAFSYKILIVDDEMINRIDLNNRFMAEGNYAILNAEDGVEALEIIEKMPDLDLVLMDVMMPRMTGIECTKIIRKRYSHYELPILMLTAKDQTKDVLEGFAAGVNDYLTKPFDREVLKARTKNLLGLRRGVKTAIEKAQSLKTEKQKRKFSEMLANITAEVTKTLQVKKIMELIVDRLQSNFEVESIAGFMMLDGSVQLIARDTLQDKEDLIASLLEHEEEDFIKDFVQYFRGSKTNKILNEVKNSKKTSSGKWIHVPIVYHERLHGLISIQEKENQRLDEGSLELMISIIQQVAASIENAKLYSRVKILATIDTLTGVFNRRHFLEKSTLELERARGSKSRYGVIMMDIDNFKKINDTFGHAIGDEVLKRIGALLKKYSDKTLLSGRFGGEEFILSAKGDKSVLKVAELLRKTVEQFEIEVDEFVRLNITVSLGVAISTSVKEDLYELIKRADINLYKAKNSGKNKVVYDENEMVRDDRS